MTSPEELERLAWEAWWSDDAAATFAAREAAQRAYLERSDAAGAARSAIWLANDELDFNGAVSVATGWLERAGRLLAALPPCSEHGWLDFERGYLAHAGGDQAAAVELGASAAQLGRHLGVPDLEMLGLALEGAARVADADVAHGMVRLDEAGAVALEGRAEVAISVAWTFCLLVSACVAIADYERASQWCGRVGAFADGHGSRYMLAYCRAEYGLIHMWHARWAEAELLLEAAVGDFERSRPAWAHGPLAGLAELRRRQRRPDEAAGLLERAGTTRAAELCRAQLELDAGRPADAASRLERLLRDTGPSRLRRAPALAVLVDAASAAGATDRAGQALGELRALEALVRTAPLAAAADRAEGVLLAARGEHERARTPLEDAVDGFARAGGVYEAAVTRLALARCLAALGHDGAAREQVTAARGCLDGLAAPPAPAPLDVLTAREREVLALVAHGFTNREIAQELVLSEHTVHRHVANLRGKLGLRTRTAAAVFAERAGLIPG